MGSRLKRAWQSLVFSLIFYASTSAAALNVWDVMRSQFMMDHAVVQVEVQTELRWLIQHPSYLQQLARAKPYIYHIVNEIKKRKLPGELALIPLIESAYDPFAYSGAGAAGLWQLMPGTGSELGLKQDWWFDGRRSIRPSTDAALNYLNYLHRFFHGNWILAIAAYDSGEGTVSRAIKNAKSTAEKANFWRLSLPRETRAYLPRLLALAEIIKYPSRYPVNLPDIPHVPYFEEVNIGSQIDLNHAAKLAGISYQDLIKLNPGFNRWATAPYKPFNLLIPINKVASFNNNLARFPASQRVSWASHLVVKGDSLDSIAKSYFTTVKLLRELNRFQSNTLKRGQLVLIPTSKNIGSLAVTKPLTKPQKVKKQRLKLIHIVQAGETLHAIEKKYRVSASQIRRWNPSIHSSVLSKGAQLTLWKIG